MSSCWRIRICDFPTLLFRTLKQPKFVRTEATTRVTRWTRGKMTSLWYMLPPILPSTLIPAPMVIVRILQYLHTYTRSFSLFNRAPVLIVIRVSYVWQTPRAKSPSKRQLEGNHCGSKPLMRDTCHVLKCAGDESGKEVTDFCMDSFFLCFFFWSQPSSVEVIMEYPKVAGQGLTGRLGVRLPTPLSGVWVPNERLPLLDEILFHELSPEIINRGLVDNLINSILMVWLCTCFMSNYFGH